MKAPDFSDSFASGGTSAWPSVTGTPVVQAGSAYSGDYGCRLAPTLSAQRLGTSTTRWAQTHRYAAIAARVRLNTLPPLGVTADVLTLQNGLQLNNFDLFVGATGKWQYDLLNTDTVILPDLVQTGRWYALEALVDFGSTSYTAQVRIDGTSTGEITSVGQTTSIVRSLLVGTSAVDRTYSFDLDDVQVAVGDTAQAWLYDMPEVALDEVIDYLGDISATPETIAKALKAERAAQARVCRIDPYTDDLAEALMRRVARNLAARAVPVASFTSFGDGGGTATRVTRTDPEVARLEAPYRKLVLA